MHFRRLVELAAAVCAAIGATPGGRSWMPAREFTHAMRASEPSTSYGAVTAAASTASSSAPSGRNGGTAAGIADCSEVVAAAAAVSGGFVDGESDGERCFAAVEVQPW